MIESIFGGRVKCVWCPKCYWEHSSGKSSYPQPTLAGGRKVPYEVMWRKLHHTKGKEPYWDDMREHVEEEHTRAETCGDS